MLNRQFEDPRLAALYEPRTPERPDFAHYLPLLMDAQAVLDVACGTGTLLRTAREQGHTGRLVGIDRSAAMLGIARRTEGIDWRLGNPASIEEREAFDLVTITGHAIHYFSSSSELDALLQVINSVLKPGGRFSFEFGLRSAHIWQQWTPEHITTVFDEGGTSIKVWDDASASEDGRLVELHTTFTSESWPEALESVSHLQFFDLEQMTEHLTRAGFAIEDRFADWEHAPLSQDSAQCVVLARRS